jgi:hypothetical protein
MKKAERSLAAAELGRRGGLKGGPARARKLSAKRRKQIARLGGLKGGPARAKQVKARRAA